LVHLRFDPVEIDHAPGIRHFTFASPLAAGQLSRLAGIRVAGDGRTMERQVPAAADPELRREPAGPARRLTWDAARYPLLVIRDPASGRVLQLARSGTTLVEGGGPELEVIASNGLRSTTVRITPTGVRR
jgi:hypothetical protein